MQPDDDPEARIRELERPLSDIANTSELGTGYYTSGGATTPLPPQASGVPPAYGAPPAWGAPPVYGDHYPPPPRKVSGGIPWLVFGLIAVVFVAIAAGVIVFTSKMRTIGDSGPGISIGGGPFDNTLTALPSMPTELIPPTVVEIPNQGGQLTISGMNENKTIPCNDAFVTVSGIDNTVTLTGNCHSVTVSGMRNVVNVDSADVLSASGFDNQVIYHSGTPEISTHGSNIIRPG